MEDYPIPTLADTIAAVPKLWEHGAPELHASDDEVVWRYMPWWKFEALICDEALYFNKLTNFLDQDPLEGAIPSNQIVADALHADAAAYHQFVEKGPVRQTYINCWHRGQTESQEMWEEYASLSEGVIVVSTVGQLRAQFCGNDDLKKGVVEPVRYIDHETDTVPSRDPFATINVKSEKDFKHEREMRLWFVYDVFYIENILATHELVPVDLKSVVHEIILAPLSDAAFADRTQSLLATKGLEDVPVRRSDLVVQR